MRSILLALPVLALLAGCADDVPESVVDEAENDGQETADQSPDAPAARFGGVQFPLPDDRVAGHPDQNAERNAYYGDLHVHTRYSFDAFVFGTTATPADAYRYARGEPIAHPSGREVQLREPLDFYAVTDHAMFLGVMPEAADPDSWFSQFEHVQQLHNLNAPDNMTVDSAAARAEAFQGFLPGTLMGVADGTIDLDRVYDISRSAWQDTIRAAEQFYQPGKFTTFVAYEYTTSSNDRGNLHRNVIFRDADRLPAIPFSRFNSQDPEGLWRWMDGLRAEGIESMAIPHNSNGSNGQMFKLVDWAGDPLDEEYASLRLRNEPLIELTQIKGTSETHPLLSDADEWADFEIMPYRVATTLYSEPVGSYAREALRHGLNYMADGMTNPFQFGFVGASDTHTAAISDDESDWFGKIGLLDSTAELRGSVPVAEEPAITVHEGDDDPTQVIGNFKEVDGKTYREGATQTWSAAGLAGVWAEENTRGAIYDAFRRKETFATSGPRIPVRFFAGYGFDEAMLGARDMTMRAYASGVPMGGDLALTGDEAPAFIAMAARDSMSAPLQRLQVIKGWEKDGETFEKVYDVACADGEPDPDTHRCPDNGASVDLATCEAMGEGAAELRTVWRDPGFDAAQHAFYYVRAIENPTCRWSTWDAIRAGEAPRADLKATIQERSWSSPIWLIPSSGSP